MKPIGHKEKRINQFFQLSRGLGQSLQINLGWSCLAYWVILPLLTVVSSGAIAEQSAPSTKDLSQEEGAPSLTSLNVRFSGRPLHPPKDMIKQTVELPGIRAARSRIGPSPQAAILEDDNRRRVVVLSPQEDGRIVAHLLADLNFEPMIPALTSCTQERRCAYDRMPVTGGLGCVAICLQEILDPENQP